MCVCMQVLAFLENDKHALKACDDSYFENADACLFCVVIDEGSGAMLPQSAGSFTLTSRRHHCRVCSASVCEAHASKRALPLFFRSTDAMWACDSCFQLHKQVHH
jgi:hypothetical protein